MVNIYCFTPEHSSISDLGEYRFDEQVQDLRVVGNRAIVLLSGCLCFLQAETEEGVLFRHGMVKNSFNLSAIIPRAYSGGFNYSSFTPYFSS